MSNPTVVTYVPTGLNPPVVTYVPTGLNPPNPNSGSSRKKDKKKKKRRRRSSSSSSSESSDYNSRSRRKSKRDRSDSSDSSSDEEDQKEKSRKSSGKGGGGGVTAEQKKALLAQKDNYVAKLRLLEDNIALLTAKEDELRATKANINLVEENKKLQTELKGRCRAIHIVLSKINNILQPNSSESSKETQKVVVIPPVPPPPPKISQQSNQSSVVQKQMVVAPRKVEQYDFYDNGQHWCRLCNVFPESIQAMLDHFHTTDHHAQVEQLGIEETPWRKRNAYQADNTVAPGAKKIPFRGMQFFSPVQGWYCRICNTYMGDHQCATEHLKSDEHNGNYLNFLDEHPDWESKWSADRQKARGRSGFPTTNPEVTTASRIKTESRPTHHSGDSDVDENAKSIRIQMRNSVKPDENRSSLAFKAKTEPPSKVDSAVDEWMGKPQKVKIDIDPQKFAAIVRQKHGLKEKEMAIKNQSKFSPFGGIREKEDSKDRDRNSREKDRNSRERDRNSRDRDRNSRDRDRNSRDREPVRRGGLENRDRRYGVEMSFSGGGRGGDRDRNRYGGGGNRGRRWSRSRSRSRDDSRSRSRSRDRYNSSSRRDDPRRRSPRRSPGPIRDRDRDSERDKGGKDREKPFTSDVKETVKKLPIIGKMPLYKKPIVSGPMRGKKPQEPEIEKKSESVGATDFFTESLKLRAPPPTIAAFEPHVRGESSMSAPSDNAMTGFSMMSSYSAPSRAMNVVDDGLGNSNSGGYGYEGQMDMSSGSLDGMYMHSSVAVSKSPVAEIPKHVERDPSAPWSGTLPDDFQQALDIIYSAPSEKPIQPNTQIPPPTFRGFGAPRSGYDYASSNMYGTYQQPPPGYEAYGSSNVYEELDEGPPGEELMSGHAPQSLQQPEMVESPMQNLKTVYEQPPPVIKHADDDMEDLRLLGIDVDDAAALSLR